MNSMEDAISQTVTAIWESMFEAEIRPKDAPADDVPGEPGLVGCIHVTGPEGGVVTLECSDALARAAASAMFGLPANEVAISDSEDALAELANVVGGNFKAMLSDGHLLSLPTVVGGRDFRTRFIGTQLAARVAFDAGGEQLVVTFFREGARASVRADARAVLAEA